MPIEINGLPKVPLTVTESKQSPSPSAGDTSRLAQTTNATAASSDSLSLTQGGLQFAELAAKLNDIPITDSERVNAVKHAIANGEYKPDLARIASKLVQLETLLYRKS